MCTSGCSGLSPLARGKRHGFGHHQNLRRFIPAVAGNTKHPSHHAGLPAVYPRWRGEHSVITGCVTTATGLSPLARGTLCHPPARGALPRFIPAGAGNTIKTAQLKVVGPVYPRWRGEHMVSGPMTGIPHGLSPLARGTHGECHRGNGAERFIPAGAGNTDSAGTAFSAKSVYPRWRGEHRTRHLHRTLSDGLSPLARGTRQ